jgi:hypothetical protein
MDRIMSAFAMPMSELTEVIPAAAARARVASLSLDG